MATGNNGLLNGLQRISGRFRDLIVDGGLTGAPLGFRLRGATTAGPPTVGTWRGGDVVHDRVGNVWTCVTGGNPGTWSAPASGWQFLSGGGQLTTSMLAAAQQANYQGWFLDPRYVWNAAGLVIQGVQNFTIESRMLGSIGYSANIAYNATGYVATGSGTDGIQIYGQPGAETQGVVLRGLALVGSNPNAVVHFAGRQRRCGMESCFALNTRSESTTVTGGAGTTVNGTNFSGTQSLTVASTAGFASSGTIILATVTGSLVTLAMLTYSGTTGTTFNNCTFAYGGGNLSTTAGQNMVVPIAAAVIDDTGIQNYNSEDQLFSHCSFAGTSGIALGIDISDTGATPQHANDTSWNDIATASSGLVSLVGAGGGGHGFSGIHYDRGNPQCYTVWNTGSTLVFTGGEDQNAFSATAGSAHLVSSGSTVIQSRNITQATGKFATVAVVTGGSLTFRGKCRANGAAPAFALTGGTLDLADPALAMGSASVTGTSGTLVLAAAYPGGSAPTVSGWSGTTSYAAVGSVTAADTSVVVGGTAAAPTVRTNTLDVIAAQHAPVASVGMNSQRVTSVATPTAGTDAATKSYVDGLVQGISAKYSAVAATTGSETFTISSGNVTQISGTTVDGISPAVNDYVLVKDAPAATGTGSAGSSQPGNGLYQVTGNTTNLSLSRAADMSGSNSPVGAYVFVAGGTANQGSGWIVTTPAPEAAFTYGTNNVQFTQFTGAGEITAGTGLAKSGNTLSLAVPVTIANGGTGQTSAAAAFNALSPMTTLGDLEYESGANTASRLAGNTTATKKFLTQTGTGSASAAPAWATVAAADLAGLLTTYKQTTAGVTPSATANTYGTQVTLNADAGFTGLLVVAGVFVTSGIASETLTVQTVITYSDNTTNTQAGLTSFTTNATSSMGANTLSSMVGAVDGKIVKSIGVQVKSSIGSSAASLTLAIIGLNLP